MMVKEIEYGDSPKQADRLQCLDLAHGVFDGYLPGYLQPQELLQVLLGRHHVARMRCFN